MWNITKEKVKEEEGIEITPGCRALALTNHSYWLEQRANNFYTFVMSK